MATYFNWDSDNKLEANLSKAVSIFFEHLDEISNVLDRVAGSMEGGMGEGQSVVAEKLMNIGRFNTAGLEEVIREVTESVGEALKVRFDESILNALRESNDLLTAKTNRYEAQLQEAGITPWWDEKQCTTETKEP